MNVLKGMVGSADALLSDMSHSATEGLASARSAVEGAMGDVREQFGHARGSVVAQARHTAEVTDHIVRAHPWQVLAGAAVAGFIAALLLNRR